MEIIITNYFSKILEKECKNTKVSEIIKKININSRNFISLKIPFYKIKLKIGNKTYRLLIFSNEKFIKIVFMNIFDKKDKKFGENINWKLSKNEILKFYEKNLEDIENGDFDKYDEYGNLI
ncbi:MAG: hypothetical protein Q9M94_06470 [Candidatus Gracilibacteria bacterium]|nr:hypothetical protein [Candidatus Gracilibacteria bacterium]